MAILKLKGGSSKAPKTSQKRLKQISIVLCSSHLEGRFEVLKMAMRFLFTLFHDTEMMIQLLMQVSFTRRSGLLPVPQAHEDESFLPETLHLSIALHSF